MGIKSIRIRNLLSFDDVLIKDIRDINCIIGQNNAGKSNLLHLIDYYYKKLNDEQVIPPSLNSSYSVVGSISIVFDTTRIRRIVTSKQANNPYQKHIYNTLFRTSHSSLRKLLIMSHIVKKDISSTYKLTLTINKNGATTWSNKNKDVRDILNRIYPFFSIDTRRLDLYDWGKLWHLISQLKFLNTAKITRNEIVEFIDSRVSKKSNSYKDYVEKIGNITKTSTYSYQEKVLNYVKVGLEGHTFNIDGEELSFQSDGTNSHKYLELFLNLIIALTRREFITPTVYIDEPEIGLHPKRNEELIQQLHEFYMSFKKTKSERELGKYKTPYPKIIIATHSPNIVKSVIRLFQNKNEHQVLHFSKRNGESTRINLMNTKYDDPRFLNIFSDNEARLFFSKCILFVEGETEIELFGNLKLAGKFRHLNSVDVYKNNDVTLKPIVPSFSNLAIPYLVLYDADVLIAIPSANGAIQYLTKKMDLREMYSANGKAYYGSKMYKLRKHIKLFLGIEGSSNKLGVHGIDFNAFRYESFIKELNKKILATNNTMLAITTIEGALINPGSIDIFYKWLVWIVMHKMDVGKCKNISKTLSILDTKLKSGDCIKMIFKSIYYEPAPPQGYKLSDKENKFIKRVKIKYLNAIKNNLILSGFSGAEYVIIFRTIFGGKTDTLSKIGKKVNPFVSRKVVDTVKTLKEEFFDLLPISYNKTGGWVTSFLDFSIDYIEINQNKVTLKDFKEEFRLTFRELSDIIEKVSFSIE